MKEFKKILILPFAITAMLFLGALTTSASNVSDVEVADAQVMADPYVGDFYIVDVTEPTGFREVQTSMTNCSFEVSSNKCTINIDGVNHDLWGYDDVDLTHKQLYEIL